MTATSDYDEFFLANYASTVQMLVSMGNSVDVAQDAAQEAFVRAYGRWRRVKRHPAPQGWIRRVAINRARDLQRSETRRRRRERRVGESEALSTSAPEGAVVGDDRTRRLLDQLTTRQRSVAALFYIEDLSVVEVAEALGLSDGAVKYHLHAARESLRALLEGEDSHG